MDIRKYLGKRTQKKQSDKSSGEESDTEESLYRADKSKTFMTCPVYNKISAQQKKLGYKKVWEKVYPWIQYEDPEVGMLCTLCKKWGRPSPNAKGEWRTRGIVDWNHTTEPLKHHSGSIAPRLINHCENG